MAVTFDKKRRNTVIICGGLKDDSPGLYERIKQDIDGKGWRHGTKSEFDRKEINIDNVRYGIFRADYNCCFVFKELLKENVPVIIAGTYTDEDLDKLLAIIDKTLPELSKDELKKLIFQVKDEEKIEGAIHWAEEFYPYFYDNIVKDTIAKQTIAIEKKTFELNTKKERLRDNVASQSYMEAKEGGI